MLLRKISARNIGCLIALAVASSSFVSGYDSIGQDSWIAVSLAALIAVPVIGMYARTMRLYPGMGLFDIAENMFGGVFGKVVIAFMTWYFLHVSSLVLSLFTFFINLAALKETPDIVVMGSLLLVAAYLSASGIHTMGKWALLIVIMILGNLVLTIAFSARSMDISHLRPVMAHSGRHLLSEAWCFGAFAFGETIVALTAFGSLKEGESPYKAYYLGLGLGAAVIISVALRNILVLGPHMLDASVFPSYIATRIVTFGNFLENVESIISFALVLMGVSKLALCLHAAAAGGAKLLGKRGERYFILPASLFALVLSLTSFEHMADFFAFAEVYRYYALPFLVIIPAAIWIAAEVKAHKRTVSS